MRNRVGIYARISQLDNLNEKSTSIIHQIELCKNYCHTNKLTVIDVYEDPNYSGSNFERPAFKKMMSDFENKKINTIMIKDLSRLGRNYIMTSELIEKIIKDGGRIISINDNYDSLTYTEELSIPLKNYLNDLYLRQSKKKSIQGKKIQMKNGIMTTYAYGYSGGKDGKLIIDNEAAKIIIEVFNRVADGESILEISKDFNERGILSPLDYKLMKSNKPINNKPWNKDMVYKITRKIQYTGNYYLFNQGNALYDEREWRNDIYPKIIDMDLYKKVQEMIASRNDKSLENVKKLDSYRINGFIYYQNKSLCYKKTNDHYYSQDNKFKVSASEIHKQLYNIAIEIVDDIKNKRISYNFFLNKYFNVKEYKDQLKDINENISHITNEADLLICDYIEEKLTHEEYEEKLHDLNVTLKELEEKKNKILESIDKIDVSKSNAIKYFDKILSLDYEFSELDIIRKTIKKCEIIKNEDGNLELKITLC